MPKPAPQKPAPDITGTPGDDELWGTASRETIRGAAGNDILHGAGGNDTLAGGEGDDILYGDEGNDTLYGQEGNDFLFGGAGNDTLWWGGYGHEELSGGSGADIFAGVTWEWTDQQVGTVLITDFESGIDKLDLTRFDANETTVVAARGNKVTGNEAFTIVAATDGVTPGHLVITTGVDALGRPITIVQGYTDTNPGADIEIHLLGTAADGGPISLPQDIWL